jgi:hypothetical protein
LSSGYVPASCHAFREFETDKNGKNIIQVQAQDDWRDDGAYRQREAETAGPFFGGFGGG